MSDKSVPLELQEIAKAIDDVVGAGRAWGLIVWERGKGVVDADFLGNCDYREFLLAVAKRVNRTT